MPARDETDDEMALRDARANLETARYEHDPDYRDRCLEYARVRLRDAEAIRACRERRGWETP